jgi:hypothetical protein
MNNTKHNAEIDLRANKEIGLEINIDKTRYMSIQRTKISNNVMIYLYVINHLRRFNNFMYLGRTLA